MADAEAAGDSSESKFLTYDGPKKGVSYPVEVEYCHECSLPAEYCDFCPYGDNCKLSMDMRKMYISDDKGGKEKEGGGAEGGAAGGEEEKKKRQTRGGRGVIKPKKKAAKEQKVLMFTQTRSKKKCVTVVQGLATYDINLKEASKFFSNKFSCGASVAAEDEIVIQGDVKDDLWDIIPDKWSQIDEDNIDDLGSRK